MRVLALLAAFAFALPVSAEMEVYHPKHRLGDDLVPMVEAVLGAEGSVAVDGNTGALVLIGTGPVIAQALELLAIQDRKLRTVLIQHETRSAHDLASSGYRIAWSAGGSSARIGNVERADSGAAVALREGRGQGTGSHGSTLRVLEGEWGRIAQGSEILLPTGSHRYPDAVRVAADSGLEVRPRILGDGRVRLDLRPFQSRLQPGGGVARQGAETTLVVTPGRTAVVGGIGRAGQASSRSVLGGASQGSARRDSLLLVTVSLEDEPGGE